MTNFLLMKKPLSINICIGIKLNLNPRANYMLRTISQALHKQDSHKIIRYQTLVFTQLWMLTLSINIHSLVMQTLGLLRDHQLYLKEQSVHRKQRERGIIVLVNQKWYIRNSIKLRIGRESQEEGLNHLLIELRRIVKRGECQMIDLLSTEGLRISSITLVIMRLK